MLCKISTLNFSDAIWHCVKRIRSLSCFRDRDCLNQWLMDCRPSIKNYQNNITHNDNRLYEHDERAHTQLIWNWYFTLPASILLWGKCWFIPSWTWFKHSTFFLKLNHACLIHDTWERAKSNFHLVFAHLLLAKTVYLKIHTINVIMVKMYVLTTDLETLH